MRLDDKGRCQGITTDYSDRLDGRPCGKKPLLYRRYTPKLVCLRCGRTYDPKTGEQIECSSWRKLPNGEFERRPPKVYAERVDSGPIEILLPPLPPVAPAAK